jgi:predicted RNA-binding Zn-ribbon protein involved in translation (DUF1610 family)
MTVQCSKCGQEWPRDPALEVTCPTCHAPVGVRCRRPSGHGGNFVSVHPARDREAMHRGFLRPCVRDSAPRATGARQPPGQTALGL